ncbi:MAG: hypothetical protein JWL77_2579 [Chthonomonadaceae bacterium]|nr:hypothetical protein [Chthonomonadaceae bacterium]
METFKNQLRTRIMLQLTLALLAVALLIPTVRGPLLQQARMLVSTPTGVAWTLRQMGIREGLPDSDPTDEQNALAAVMRRNRQNYLIQTAFALCVDSLQKPQQEDERVRQLRLILPAFPSNPGLYAHILRMETANDITIRRDTEYETFMNGRASQYTATEDNQTATSDALTNFDHDAAVGEQLDPQNGYFPMMRAVGLFAAHRDDEAIAAVRRAAQKPKWNDYTGEETAAVWLLAADAFGNRSAAIHTVLSASVSLPHLKQLRNVARMTVFKAAHLEKSGKMEEGIALRQAGIECGALVRTYSIAPRGGYYGAEMSEFQWLRPGGAPPLALAGDMPPDQKNTIRRDAFLTYLKQSGHDAEAARAQTEFDAARRARSILDKSADVEYVTPPRQAKSLTGWWIGGNALLANSIEMFLLGMVALALARRKRRMAPMLGERRDNPLIPAIVVVTVLLLFVAVAVQTQWGSGFGSLRGALHTLSYTGGDPDSPARFLEPPGAFSMAGPMQIVAVLLSITVPVVALIALVFFSAQREQELETTILRNLPEVGASLGLALLLLYLACNLLTTREEARVETVLQHNIQSGNRAIAELEKTEWPAR